jgi:hypothetical protein
MQLSGLLVSRRAAASSWLPVRSGADNEQQLGERCEHQWKLAQFRESSGLVVSVDAVAGQWCAWSFGEAWAVSDTAPCSPAEHCGGGA